MSTIEHAIPVTSFKSKGSPVTVLNWPQLEAHYDLEHPKKGTVNLLFIVNQFIHSYIFLPCYDDRGCVDGVFVSSDRERKKSLRLVTLADIVEIFGLVGTDYPTMLQAKFNESQEDYDVVLDSRWTAR